jgi:diguanylate cyclase (GGDEF)-like protein
VLPTNDNNSKTDRNTIAESISTNDEGSFKQRLIVVSGMMLGLQIELRDEPITIGRASECALSLQHPSVSRHHCEISHEGNRYFLEDLGSTNRTYLNGKPIRREELHDGDQISVGNNAIKFFTGSSLEAKYHDELIDLAIYDSLTGFYNRRHFRTLLDEEIERAKGTVPISVLMMDLDHFKDINDRYGHLVGDQVLTSAAQIMRTNAPTDAPFGRLGGEEFALILHDKNLQQAVALAESLRSAIETKPIETRDQRLPITISIGVAQTNEKLKNSAELLSCADDRLYRAKQAGRNRVWAQD